MTRRDYLNGVKRATALLRKGNLEEGIRDLRGIAQRIRKDEKVVVSGWEAIQAIALAAVHLETAGRDREAAEVHSEAAKEYEDEIRSLGLARGAALAAAAICCLKAGDVVRGEELGRQALSNQASFPDPSAIYDDLRRALRNTGSGRQGTPGESSVSRGRSRKSAPIRALTDVQRLLKKELSRTPEPACRKIEDELIEAAAAPDDIRIRSLEEVKRKAIRLKCSAAVKASLRVLALEFATRLDSKRLQETQAEFSRYEDDHSKDE